MTREEADEAITRLAAALEAAELPPGSVVEASFPVEGDPELHTRRYRQERPR